jgi:hypothetical protein
MIMGRSSLICRSIEMPVAKTFRALPPDARIARRQVFGQMNSTHLYVILQEINRGKVEIIPW